MKILSLLFPLLFALCAAAQSTARPPPKGSEVVDRIPPPPAVKDYTPPAPVKDAKVVDPKQPQPDVTVRKDGDNTIEEYRIRGKLYKQRVTPGKGPAYTLIDEKGEGKFTRVDGPDLKYAVPMWVLVTW